MSSLERSPKATAVAGNSFRPAMFAGLMVLAVGVLSFLPLHDKQRLHTKGRLHEWGHLFVFMTVAFVLLSAAKTWPTRLLCFAGALLFGLAIELGQHRVYGMPVETTDILVDIAGVMLGSLAAVLIASRS